MMLVMMLGPQPRVNRVGVETVPRGGRSYTQVQPGLAGTSGQNTNTKYKIHSSSPCRHNFKFSISFHEVEDTKS